jgi:eukaryotic-like serine/threonine-protein kinase
VSEATPSLSPTLPLGSTKEFVPDTLVGTLLDGRYRLLAHLASGGMGAVFEAEHVRMEKIVAVKVLRPELSTSEEIAERFRREARIYASLEHPNIVRVGDFGRTPDGILFLAMEYLEGESLRARLDREGALAMEDALPILIDIASALGAAHQRGIVHRDLKPENIHLAQTRQPVLVKVLDFGIAKIIRATGGDITRHGSVLGTPKYIAPEQAVGMAVDARADVYALGMLAWRMLGGRHPFEGLEPMELLLAQATQPVPSLAEARPDLASHPMVAVLAKACAKDADLRHRDGAELERDLRRCRAGSVTPAQTSAPPRELWTAWHARAARAWKQVRTNESFMNAAAGVVALILALAAIPHFSIEAQAERLIETGEASAARAMLEPAVASDPDDGDLHHLLGRALHAISGEEVRGIEAYARAHRLDPEAADKVVVDDLIGDLGLDRKTAELAADVLARIGQSVVPALVRAADDGPPLIRARALVLLGELEATAGLDRMSAFVALLRQSDCQARRIAALALGDLGDAEAIPALRELSRRRKRDNPCGAEEAMRAIRRIEEARSL